MPESDLGLVLVLIGVLGIGAQWLAWRLQWPPIVLLCLFLPAMFWDKDGRSLHDKAAGTLIVRA